MRDMRLSRLDAVTIVLSVFILFAILLSIPDTSRQSARRTKCMSNVRSIAGGLNNYMSAFGMCPVPAPQFRGDCWLATLYWTNFLSDKRIFICPLTLDDSTKLQEPNPTSSRNLAKAEYPISQADFAKAETIPTDAISYCGRTNMSGLSAQPTPTAKFTEKGLAGLPVVCDAPYNHPQHNEVNTSYLDQHVEPLEGGCDYVGWPPRAKEARQPKLEVLRAMDSGDNIERMPPSWLPPSRSEPPRHVGFAGFVLALGAAIALAIIAIAIFSRQRPPDSADAAKTEKDSPY